MVNKKRLIPSIFIFIYVIFFYFFDYDLIFISVISLFCLYDLQFSKIINKNYSYLLIFLFSFLVLLSNYFNYLIIIYFILFLILIFLFFILNENKKILFIYLIFIFLISCYELIIYDKNLFFLILLLSFINDTSAFFFGKLLKGPLIIKSVSPNKTWTGTLSSLCISSLILFLFNYNLFFCFFVCSFYFFGDLFFSYYKRVYNMKDFSNLLGGHGGILDRIDSIFFVVFIFIFNQIIL